MDRSDTTTTLTTHTTEGGGCTNQPPMSHLHSIRNIEDPHGETVSGRTAEAPRKDWMLEDVIKDLRSEDHQENVTNSSLLIALLYRV